MKTPARGCPVTFAPDHSGTYEVEFAAQDGEPWRERVLGWAVVPVGYDDAEDGEGGVVLNTRVQPVVIDPSDGWPATVDDYIANRQGPMRWRVRPT